MRLTLTFLAAFVAATRIAAGDPILVPPYDANYQLIGLGTVPGVSLPFHGFAFKPDDPNTLIVGGGGTTIYTASVLRDSVTHDITGFGTASPVISAATDLFGGLSGGLAYGPGGVLFFNTFFFDRLGEIKPGSTNPDKVVELLFQGIGLAGGSIAFVPDRFNDAGKLLVGMWDTGNMCTANLTPDGTGTYNISSCVHQTMAVGAGGQLGIAYAPPGSPNFGPSGGMLVSEVFDFSGQISAYAVDANGLLIPGSHQTFVAGASGAGSMTTDPVTGDLLFTWGGGASQFVEVRGFTPGVAAVPEPAALLFMVTGLGSLAFLRRRTCR